MEPILGTGTFSTLSFSSAAILRKSNQVSHRSDEMGIASLEEGNFSQADKGQKESLIRGRRERSYL
jgi:hypothetical protein